MGTRDRRDVEVWPAEKPVLLSVLSHLVLTYSHCLEAIEAKRVEAPTRPSVSLWPWDLNRLLPLQNPQGVYGFCTQ